MHFGDFSDPDSQVSQIVTKKEAVLLKGAEGVEPSVYYCPPRARRRL